MKQKKPVRIFTSFEEENAGEHSRRKKMSMEERLREFYKIQCRQWGKKWFHTPVRKIVSIEKISW